VQEALDLASHVVADEGWGPVSSLREHFSPLGRRRALREGLARQLADAVELRNPIGHAYAAVDPARLHAAARALLSLLERFCEEILAFAESRPRGPG